jgi:hypothetical protein
LRSTSLNLSDSLDAENTGNDEVVRLQERAVQLGQHPPGLRVLQAGRGTSPANCDKFGKLKI